MELHTERSFKPHLKRPWSSGPKFANAQGTERRSLPEGEHSVPKLSAYFLGGLFVNIVAVTVRLFDPFYAPGRGNYAARRTTEFPSTNLCRQSYSI
jgi:hypothetical protein